MKIARKKDVIMSIRFLTLSVIFAILVNPVSLAQSKQVVNQAHPRITYFIGGRAIVETNNRYGGIEQRITIKDAKGNLISSSLCYEADVGKYEDIVRFGAAVKMAAFHEGRFAFEKLVKYPLRINSVGRPSKVEIVTSSRSLFDNYSRIFTQKVQ